MKVYPGDDSNCVVAGTSAARPLSEWGGGAQVAPKEHPITMTKTYRTIFVAGVGMSGLVFGGCDDLRLVDGGVTGTGDRKGTDNEGGAGQSRSNAGGLMMLQAGATASSRAGSGAAGGAAGAPEGGVGAQSASGAGSAATPFGGGVSSGGSSYAGASAGGRMSGTAGVGGLSNGGAAGGKIASGGASVGDAGTTLGAGQAGRGNAGAENGGKSASGGTNGGAGNSGGTAACRFPSEKPFALRASEPQPADPCARVSTVSRMNESNMVFGFTNGEIWRFASITENSRVDVSSIPIPVGGELPRAIVSQLRTHRDPESGSLEVAYADERQVSSTWHVGMLGRAWWSPWPARSFGSFISVFSCPFHVSATDHRIVLTAPGTLLQEATAIDQAYSTEAPSCAKHLGLGTADEITTLELYHPGYGWQVFVGGRDGSVKKSPLFDASQSVLWNENTQQLDQEVLWTDIRSSVMPAATVLRIAVHPVNSSKIFVLLDRRLTADALWYTSDGGTTWTNRHGSLPVDSQVSGVPALIGVTFHPTYPDAAYVVTVNTSYYTTDAGKTWREW